MATIPLADYFSNQVIRNRRFFLPDWKARAEDARALGLVGGGCEWCAPDFLIERQSLPFFSFEFVSRGRGSLTLAGAEYALSAGHAFFYDSTIPHRISSSAEEPLVKYFLNLAGRSTAELWLELELTPSAVIRVMDAARIVALLDEGIDQVLRADDMGQKRASVAIEHAIVLCADGRQPAGQKRDPAYECYLRCRTHLLRNYMVLVNVEEAAAQCHVSAPYFTRLFKRYDSETPLACLTRLKLSQALLLLRESGSQVKTVAHDLGYRSAAHFSRAFKSWHGRTPQSIALE